MGPLPGDFMTCVGVFEAEFDYVYHALRRQGVARSDLEDLVQEVFLVMWRRWDQYDASRPLRPWLAGIAFRVGYSHRQRVGREVPGGFLDLKDVRPDPEQNVAMDDARSLVRRVLDSLPEKHRWLIHSHHVDGVSVRDLAEALAVPIPTAHTRLRAARKAFAKAYKQLQVVSSTRARLAPLLDALAASEPSLAAQESQQARQRAVARVRRLALLPGFGLPGPRARPTTGIGAAGATGLTRAWLPVGGAALAGALGLLLVLGNDSRALSLWYREAPRLAVARAHASAPPAAVASAPLVSLPGLQPVALRTPAPAESALGKGLIGYWRFDEPYGSSAARDLSGHGNDCLLRKLDPAAAWTEGRLGGAITLDGQGWLECSKVEAFGRLGADMTISLWLRRLGTQRHVRALVTQQYGSAERDTFHLGFRDDELWMRTRYRGQATLAPFPRARGPWHHLAVTLDAGGRTRLFIDGEQVMQRRRDGQPPLGGVGNPLIIGGGVNGPDPSLVNELFHGVIDELAVHARKLESAEIRALAAGAQPPLSP